MKLRQMPIRCNKREVCNLIRFDGIAQTKVLIFALKTPSKSPENQEISLKTNLPKLWFLEGVFNAKISTFIWAIASKRNKLHTSRLLHRIGICLSFISMCITVELKHKIISCKKIFLKSLESVKSRKSPKNDSFCRFTQKRLAHRF
eukprot:sb/3473856/